MNYDLTNAPTRLCWIVSRAMAVLAAAMLLVAYRPVEWLIDETSFRGPLDMWAECQGVADDQFFAECVRAATYQGFMDCFN